MQPTGLDNSRPAKQLTRIIHVGSSRNRAIAKRDGQAQPQRSEAYLQQYVERLSGEHARHTKLRLSRRVRSHRGGEALCLRLLMLALSQRRIGVPVALLLQWA